MTFIKRNGMQPYDDQKEWLFVGQDRDKASFYIDLSSVPNEIDVASVVVNIVPEKGSDNYRSTLNFLATKGQVNSQFHRMEQTWTFFVRQAGVSKHFAVMSTTLIDEHGKVLYRDTFKNLGLKLKPVQTNNIANAIYNILTDIWKQDKDSVKEPVRTSVLNYQIKTLKEKHLQQGTVAAMPGTRQFQHVSPQESKHECLPGDVSSTTVSAGDSQISSFFRDKINWVFLIFCFTGLIYIINQFRGDDYNNFVAVIMEVTLGMVCLVIIAGIIYNRYKNTNTRRYFKIAITIGCGMLLFVGIIQNTPKNRAAKYCNLGNTCLKIGNYPKAIQHYGRAIELNPESADAYTNRGYVYKKIGNYTQAIKDYDKIIEMDPKNAVAYLERAMAYIKIKNSRMAIEDLKIAARLGSKEAQDVLKQVGYQ